MREHENTKRVWENLRTQCDKRETISNWIDGNIWTKNSYFYGILFYL